MTVTKTKFKLFFLLSVLSVFKIACGQFVISPAFFNNLESNFILQNPAVAGDTIYSITFGHNFNTGLFTSVSSSFLHGTYSGKRNSIQILAWKEQRGEYISRSRIYAGYAHKLPISENIKIGMGTRLGIISANYTAPSAAISGSDFSPDLEAGLLIEGKTWKAGMAGRQLLFAEMRPVTEILIASPELNVFAEKLTYLTPGTALRGFGIGLRSKPGIHAGGGASVIIEKIFLTSLGYISGKGIFATIGLDSFSFSKRSEFSFYASYKQSTEYFRANTLEIQTKLSFY